MSDLHCPARVVLCRPGPVAPLAAQLAGQRVALVWGTRMPSARRTGRELARLLGVPADGPPDDTVSGNTAAAVSSDENPVDSTLFDTVSHLADLHRGETVVVVLGEAGWPDALGAVPRDVDLLPLEVDADGWRLGRDGGVL